MTALNPPVNAETHWVVSAEYADLLRGNPKIKNVIAFDRKTQGLLGWVKLNRFLASESFDEVLDLHSTLRTRLARCVFWWSCFLNGRTFPKWTRISKTRFRRIGYTLFKRLWPKVLLPKPLRDQFLEKAGETRAESEEIRVQDLRYLSEPRPSSGPIRYGIMPGSAWPGKRWPVDSFLELIHGIKRSRPDWIPVLFGDPNEESVSALQSDLKASQVQFESKIGKKTYRDLAREMMEIDFLISNDTGLSHLAEGLRKPSVVLFGPTTPEFGFAPGLHASKSLGSKLWCRPCGKDGSLCFRLGEDRFACMKKLDPSIVLSAAVETGDRSRKQSRSDNP